MIFLFGVRGGDSKSEFSYKLARWLYNGVVMAEIKTGRWIYLAENDKSGIYSLAGFAYQMKVFILQLLQLKHGYTLEYETIDDVAVKIEAEEIDECEDQFCSILTTNTREAIQVKKTLVTETVAKRVVKNWILADRNSSNIEKFILVTDKDVADDVFTSINEDDILVEVTAATGVKSIDAKVKLVGYSDDELRSKITNIISKSTIQKHMDIDQEIVNDFGDFFIRPAVTEATYILRIKQLIQQITVDILDAMIKGKAYKLSYEELCYVKNRIISEITDEKWEPSFAQFRKLKKVNLSDLAVIKSREYQQLIECTSLTSEDISRHLQYGEYYANSKRSYFERGMNNIVEDLENTAYDNFCDVKMELRNKVADTPDNRLVETKAKSNARAVDDQIRYGVCINLTSENTDANIQISWKDD